MKKPRFRLFRELLPEIHEKHPKGQGMEMVIGSPQISESIIYCASPRGPSKGRGRIINQVKGCHLPVFSAQGTGDSGMIQGFCQGFRPRREGVPSSQPPARTGYHVCACACPYMLPLPQRRGRPQKWCVAPLHVLERQGGRSKAGGLA